MIRIHPHGSAMWHAIALSMALNDRDGKERALLAETFIIGLAFRIGMLEQRDGGGLFW